MCVGTPRSEQRAALYLAHSREAAGSVITATFFVWKMGIHDGGLLRASEA
jgi:hypothetical protein